MHVLIHCTSYIFLFQFSLDTGSHVFVDTLSYWFLSCNGLALWRLSWNNIDLFLVFFSNCCPNCKEKMLHCTAGKVLVYYGLIPIVRAYSALDTRFWVSFRKILTWKGTYFCQMAKEKLWGLAWCSQTFFNLNWLWEWNFIS